MRRMFHRITSRTFYRMTTRTFHRTILRTLHRTFRRTFHAADEQSAAGRLALGGQHEGGSDDEKRDLFLGGRGGQLVEWRGDDGEREFRGSEGEGVEEVERAFVDQSELGGRFAGGGREVEEEEGAGSGLVGESDAVGGRRATSQVDAADVVDFGGDETPGFIDEEEAMAERCGGERDSREEWGVVEESETRGERRTGVTSMQRWSGGGRRTCVRGGGRVKGRRCGASGRRCVSRGSCVPRSSEWCWWHG